jgi:hypothetical protein
MSKLLAIFCRWRPSGQEAALLTDVDRPNYLCRLGDRRGGEEDLSLSEIVKPAAPRDRFGSK